MPDEKKPEEWFTLENFLKVGAGVAAGVAGVKLLQGAAPAAPKKASANTEAPARRRKGKRRAAKSGAAPKTGSASAYTQFVQEKMPGYTARGIKSSVAMSRIAEEWKASKGR